QRIEDSLGNVATFTWSRDGNQLYLALLAYGAYELKFNYENRPDPIRWGRAGFLITTKLRCASIELHLPSSSQPLLRRWTLGYTQLDPNGSSALTSITLRGFDEASNPLDAPPMRLDYSSLQTPNLQRFQNVDESASPGPLSRSDRRM